MSSGGIKKLAVDAAPRENVVAQIVITMTTDGRIQCHGPLDQATMCYGLLEEAKYQINDLRLKKDSCKLLL